MAHDQYNPHSFDEAEGQGCRNWAIGCGIIMILAIGLLIVAGFFVVRNAKEFATRAAVQGIEEGIRNSQLPPDQQQAIIQRVKELGEDFRSGALSFDELFEIAENISESRPVIAGGAEFLIRTHVLDSADLDEATQTRTNRLVQRLARGIVEEKLDEDDFKPLLDIVVEEVDDGDYRRKRDLSEEEVAAFIDQLQQMVDDAEIPDEPYEIDLASELDRIIAEARNGQVQQ